MRPEAVTYENSRFMIRSRFGKRIEYMLNPVQANCGVSVPSFGTGKVPPGVGCVVQVLRCVAAGQVMSGERDLPSAEIHLIAVTSIRLTPAPLQLLRSSLLTKTLRELKTLKRTPVSSILYMQDSQVI
jgi:hypothetical protein